MGRRKGKAARGKRRVSGAPMEYTMEELLAMREDIETMVLPAGDRCPLCVAWGVELRPYGDARVTGQAAVDPVQHDTV